MNNMNRPNMRRALKQPTLRMEEGGAVGVATSTPEMMASAAAAGKANVAGFNNQTANLQKMNGTPPVAAPSAPVAPDASQRQRQALVGPGIFGQPVNVSPITQSGPIGLREGGEIHADVGGMWANAKRAVTGQAPETPSEAMNRRLNRPTPAPATAQPAPAPAQPAPAPAAPMGSQAVLDNRMKAAGLRHGGDLETGHGGDVPGTGTGDKIPAKYEPGEFVVSNDMLDAQPELRGHLQTLRKDVLAEKGMTPEQADAKALGNPKGLRAMDAGDWANLTKNELGAGQAGVQAMEESAVPRGMGGNAGRTAAIAEQTRLMQQPAGEVLRYTPTPSAAVPPVAPPVAPPAAPAVSAPKGIPGRMADAVMNPLKSAGQAVADKATAFAKAADAHMAKSPTLRMAGELAKEYPKTANVLGKVAKVGGTVANAMYSGDVGAGSTLDAAHVAALNKPWSPDTPAIVRPGENQGGPLPTQASYSNEGTGAAPAVVPEAPKTLRGGDGRDYLPETVSNDDRLQSDQMLNSVFGRRDGSSRANTNLRGLADNADMREVANQAWAKRGAGIRVDAGPNGSPTFSNSTGPEKMQYVDTKGNPTSEYRNTNQYAEGMQERGKLLAAGAAADQRTAAREATEADARERASIPAIGDFGHNTAQKAYENKATLRQQTAHNAAQIGVDQDRTKAMREGHQLDYDGRMAPVLLAQKNQQLIQQVMGHEAVGGDLAKGAKALNAMGRGDLAKTLHEQIASEQSARASDQADGTARAKAMDDSFKGRFEKVNEKGETVEDDAAAKIAADQFRLATEGKNLTPDQVAEHHHNAMMHAKLVQRLQGKARLRDDGLVNRLNPFGDNRSVPSNLPADLTRSTVGWFDGARTGHGIEKGDHYLGDPSLNIAIPADTPDDELQYLARLKAQRAGDKAKLRN